MRSPESLGVPGAYSLRERLSLDGEGLKEIVEEKLSANEWTGTNLVRHSKKNRWKLTTKGREVADEIFREVMGEEVWPLRLAEFRASVKDYLALADEPLARQVGRSLLGKVDHLTRKMVWEKESGKKARPGFKETARIYRETRGIRLAEIDYANWEREYWLGCSADQLYSWPEKAKNRWEEETALIQERIEEKALKVGFDLKKRWQSFKDGLAELRPKIRKTALPALAAFAGLSFFGVKAAPANQPMFYQTACHEISAPKIMEQEKSFSPTAGEKIVLGGEVFNQKEMEVKMVLPTPDGNFAYDEAVICGYPFDYQEPTVLGVHSGAFRKEDQVIDLPGEVVLANLAEGRTMNLSNTEGELKMEYLGRFSLPAEKLVLEVEVITAEAIKQGFDLNDGRKYLALVTCTDWNQEEYRYEERTVVLFASKLC